MEGLPFLSFSNRAAEEEKTEKVLDSVRKSKPFFDSGFIVDGQGATDDGTKTTE